MHTVKPGEYFCTGLAAGNAAHSIQPVCPDCSHFIDSDPEGITAFKNMLRPAQVAHTPVKWQPENPTEDGCAICILHFCGECNRFFEVFIRFCGGAMIVSVERTQVQQLATEPPCPGDSPIEIAFARAYQQLTGSYPRGQVVIGPYRVDFVCGEKLVVECDGHAYHSSKERRGADAKRDRTLLSMGFSVIRFTGTQIHANAAACAREAYDLCK